MFSDFSHGWFDSHRCLGPVFRNIFQSRSFGGVAYSRGFQQEPKISWPASVKEAPRVVSNIQGLQITEVRLVNQGTAQAAIQIDVTNNRDSAVMGLDFIWRYQQYTGGNAMDGLLEDGNPRVIIPPHTLKTLLCSWVRFRKTKQCSSGQLSLQTERRRAIRGL